MNIINPIEKVKQAIPQLNSISDYNNSIYLSNQQWNNRMKTIESKNLKQFKHSTSWISLSIYFNPCVICIHDGETIEVNQEKYKLIRQYVMSDEFNKRSA